MTTCENSKYKSIINKVIGMKSSTAMKTMGWSDIIEFSGTTLYMVWFLIRFFHISSQKEGFITEEIAHGVFAPHFIIISFLAIGLMISKKLIWWRMKKHVSVGYVSDTSKKDKTICPHCYKRSPTKLKTCFKCGEPLYVSEKNAEQCSHCGTKLRPEDKTCYLCETPIPVDEEQ